MLVKSVLLLSANVLQLLKHLGTSRWVAASAIVPASFAIAVPAAKAATFGTISEIYVFGDSYSEDGTALDLSTQAVEAGVPDAFILPADPALALYDEAGRWTNGPTAVEVLGENLQVDLTNYAVGGAKSGNGNYYSWLDPVQDTGLFGQIDQFAAETGSVADPDALYFVFISANDLFEYVDFGLPGTVEELAAETVGNITQGVSELAALEAEQFLIVNSSELGIVPGVIEFGQTEEAALFTTEGYSLLPDQLTSLSQDLDADIALYDHTAISDKIRATPAVYGLTDVDTPCQPVFPVESVCANPDEYYFWDEYHPTEQAHGIIGNDMTAFVTERQSQPVPEPSIVGSILLLGGLGVLSKKRQSI